MSEIKKILCAVDLSEHSKTVADHAVTLAKATGASITVVYAAPTLNQYTGFHVPPKAIDSFVSEIVSGAEVSLNKFVEENTQGVEANAVVVVGYPAEEILKLADLEKADMIVMGTHGRKGLDRVLFGSVAEKIVMKSPVPVLTIRPSEGYKGGAMYKD